MVIGSVIFKKFIHEGLRLEELAFKLTDAYAEII